MISKIFRQALAVVMKKPLKLWGISILCSLLCYVFTILFIGVPGISLAICLAISTSMTMIFLYGYRGQEPKAADLFECLKDGKTAKRTIGGMAWMMLWIFIYGLIPVVGPIIAIVKAYSYRLTPYILVLEQDVKITDAIHVSERRTYGFKGKMFGADVLIYAVYLGLEILQVILVSIFSGISEELGIFISFIFALFMLFVAIVLPLFMGLVQAAFYEEIMGSQSYQSTDTGYQSTDTGYQPYEPAQQSEQTDPTADPQPTGYQPYQPFQPPKV